MPQSINEHLEEVFKQASATYVRNKLKSVGDEAEIMAIHREAAEKLEDITRIYHEEYDARVDAVRQRLYDEAAKVKLDHPAPFGASASRDEAITREAHREVRLAHEADLRRTEDNAQTAFEDLLRRTEQRNQVKGTAVEAFRSASDRRSGEDRRTPRMTRD